jgi:hypothetical protein
VTDPLVVMSPSSSSCSSSCSLACSSGFESAMVWSTDGRAAIKWSECARWSLATCQDSTWGAETVRSSGKRRDGRVREESTNNRRSLSRFQRAHIGSQVRYQKYDVGHETLLGEFMPPPLVSR